MDERPEITYRRRFVFHFQDYTDTVEPTTVYRIFPENLSAFYWLGPFSMGTSQWCVEVFNEAAPTAHKVLADHPAVISFQEALDGGKVE